MATTTSTPVLEQPQAIAREAVRIPHRTPRLPALYLTRDPRGFRSLTLLVVLSLIALPVVLLFVPWQQNVMGSGRVVAYDPKDRPQRVDSPINARIKKWHVVEGTRVKVGQRMVDLVDNDPNYLDNLKLQRSTFEAKLKAYETNVLLLKTNNANIAAEGNLKALVKTSELNSVKEKIKSADAEIVAVNAKLRADTEQVKRLTPLANEGVNSRRDYEIAESSYRESLAKLEKAKADLESVKQTAESYEQELKRIPAEVKLKQNDNDTYLQKAISEVETGRKELNEIGVKIAQQGTQHVDAPVDGIIFRIRANQETTGQVKSGDVLLEIVPDTESRVVELYIDGNDAPLITDRPIYDEAGIVVRDRSMVRIQFEGWPAVQFVGWPSVAVGTFGGRVILVDPTDDGNGKFRILVEPDGEQPWPHGRWLRQGVRAKGWVLLQQVPLGWEIWRRLNGFPPVILDKEPGETVKIKLPK